MIFASIATENPRSFLLNRFKKKSLTEFRKKMHSGDPHAELAWIGKSGGSGGGGGVETAANAGYADRSTVPLLHRRQNRWLVPEITHRKRTCKDCSSSKSKNDAARKSSLLAFGGVENNKYGVGVTEFSFDERLECTNSTFSVLKAPTESRDELSKDVEYVVLVGSGDRV